MTTPSDDKNIDDENLDAREAFQELRKAHEARPQRPTSKQERARREEDRAVVEAASDRTLEGIVKGLAEVQLDFDGSVKALMDTLGREVATLRDTRRAIEVQTRRAEDLRNVKIAADALDLLKQEHARAAEALDEEHRARREVLEQEIAEQQAAWAKEGAAFEQKVQQRDAERQAARERAEEEYEYEQTRERRNERDAYEQKKRETERRLQEQQREKDADWAEREAALEARRDRLERYQRQLEAFEQQKEEAVAAAREEALTSAREEAEAQAALVEGEEAAQRRSYEARIDLLEADIARQSEQIDQLTSQLQAALRQTQTLAARAMGRDADRDAGTARAE